MLPRGEIPLHIMVIAASPERRAYLEATTHKAAQVRITASPAVSVERIFQTAPDQVLVDIESSFVAQAVVRAAEALPATTGVITLADNPESGWVSLALRAGVNAILSREITAEELRLAILAAEAGLVLLHSSSVHRSGWQPSTQDHDPPDLAEALTVREQEVLRLVSDGLANKEIAERLKISDHTVKFHISSILGKLGASSRTEAVSQGIRKGLIVV